MGHLEFLKRTVILPWAALFLCGCEHSRPQSKNLPSAAPGPSYIGPQDAGLQIPQEALDFGRVWSTSDFGWSLPLRNSTASPLIVESLSTSCGCTVLSGLELPIEIPAHSFRDIPVAMDLRGRPLLSGADRPFSVHVYAGTAAGDTGSWEIRGKVGDAYWMKTPEDLELRLIAGSGRGCSIEVPFGKVADVSEIHGTSTIDGLEVSTFDSSSPNDFRVQLTRKSTLAPGIEHGNLTLEGTLNDNVVISNWPVKIVTVSEIRLVPEFTHFGAVSPGVKSVFNYSCISRLGRSLRELDIDVSDEVNAMVTVQERNNSFSLSVVAVAEGNFSFDVIITERGVSGTDGSVPSPGRIHCSGLAHTGI